MKMEQGVINFAWEKSWGKVLQSETSATCKTVSSKGKGTPGDKNVL